MAPRRKATTGLSLPTLVNEPPAELHEQCAMIFGRKSWGKTTLASQYPNALTLLLELGRKNLRILQVPPAGTTVDWEGVLEYINLFLESDYQVIIIDTLDRMYDRCFLATCLGASEGTKTHPDEFGDGSYGMWDAIKTNFEAPFEAIRGADKVFVAISHDKKTEHKASDGTKWEQIVPTCKPAAWKIVQMMSDFVFHCDFIAGERVVTVRDLQNTTLASCGRDDVFLDADTGKPLERFVIPNQASKAYETLLAAYNNEVRDFNSAPPDKPIARKAAGDSIKKAVSATNGATVKKRTLPKK